MGRQHGLSRTECERDGVCGVATDRAWSSALGSGCALLGEAPVDSGPTSVALADFAGGCPFPRCVWDDPGERIVRGRTADGRDVTWARLDENTADAATMLMDVARGLGDLRCLHISEPRRARVPLDAMVRDAVGRVDVPESVTLLVDPAPLEDTWAHIDAELVVELLEAILVNAVEACTPEGTVTLRLAADAAALVAVVSDDARGSFRADAFEFFVTSKQGRWGIGLPAAQIRAFALGGRVVRVARAGGGSHVVVVVPLAPVGRVDP